MFLSPRESLQPHSAKRKAQSHQPVCLEKEKRTRQGSTHGGTLKRKSPRGQSAANIYRAKRVGVKMSGSDFEFGASGHTSNANFLLFRSRRPAANSKIYKDKPIKPGTQSESEFERRPSSSLWDTVIRVALIGGLAVLCFQVFSPFLNLTVWSIILAITMPTSLHSFRASSQRLSIWPGRRNPS